jgi:hypothetical protein
MEINCELEILLLFFYLFRKLFAKLFLKNRFKRMKNKHMTDILDFLGLGTILSKGSPVSIHQRREVL